MCFIANGSQFTCLYAFAENLYYCFWYMLNITDSSFLQNKSTTVHIQH